MAPILFGLKKTYQDIAPRDAQERLKDQTIILIDVRTAEEHAERHIPGSITIPLSNLVHEVKQQYPDLDIPIMVYCQSGARSARAAGTLTKLGYKQVFNLGGINNWPFATQSSK